MSKFELKAGHPDIVSTGYVLLRAAYDRVGRPTDDDEGRTLNWALSPGLSENGEVAIIVGDLTIWSEHDFAGVQVGVYLAIRGQIPASEADWSLANDLVREHADWVSHGLYDFAAHTLRAMLSGGSSHLNAPRWTPDHELNLIELSELETTGDEPDATKS